MKTTKGMQPDAAASLNNALADIHKAGIPVSFNGGYRSPEEQKALYEKSQRGENPYPVAPPGHSNHQLGIAADLGIPPKYREQANSILAQHGWEWHGPSDAVHYDFSSALKNQQSQQPMSQGQFDAITAAQAQQMQSQPTPQMPSYDPTPEQQAAEAQMREMTLQMSQMAMYGAGAGGGMLPQDQGANPYSLPSPTVDPEQRTPSDNSNSPWWRRALDYGENYLYNTVGNSGNDLGQRLNYAVKPLGDAANALTFGQVGNVLQHSFSPLRAGVLQAAANEAGGIRDNGDLLGAFSPAARSAEWQSMVKAWNGQQDPTLPRGIGNALAGTDNPLTQAIDFAGDWYAGGKFAHTFFSPFIRGAGSALGTRLGSTLADAAEQPDAGLGTKAASALVNRGIGGNIRPVLDTATAGLYKQLGGTAIGRAVIPSLQAFANTGQDFRQGIESVVKNTSIVRTLENFQERINNQIADGSKILRGQGADITGNSLAGTHWENEVPEAVSRLPEGNLLGHLIYHYAEAGSPGAMFDGPDEVLQHATKLFPDNPDIAPMVQKIGEEARSLALTVGKASVDSGVMDGDTYAENAGRYMPHNFAINGMSRTEAAEMAQGLAQEGHGNTQTYALINNIAENGGSSEGPRMVGKGGVQDVIKEREVLDPYERLARLPDFDYTGATKNALKGQLREVARANILKEVSNPRLGMSLSNLAANIPTLHPALDKQPELVGEQARNAKAYAGIQNQFEKKGGVNDTQNAIAAKLDKAGEAARTAQEKSQAHYANEPQQPPMPGLRPSVEPELRSGGVVNEAAVARGTPHNRGNVVSVAAGARGVDAVRQALNNTDLDQYAKDLSSWQKAHKAWRGGVADLQDKVTKANDTWRSTKAAHDEHLQLIDTLNQKAEQLKRRNDLLSGSKAPDDDDAADALAKAMKKVDPSGQLAASMPPETQRALMDSWKQNFIQHNHDIFSDIGPKGLPKPPHYLDPKVVEAMGQNNPLIAMALHPELSAPDGGIDAVTAAQKGWMKWGSAGEDYGPMNNRWGSIALKKFIDDAMDPHRFGGAAEGGIGGITKFLGEMMRSGKLYLNPASHANVFVQSVMDNMATAADAGKAYNPLSDLTGRKEWNTWLHGGPVTPTVQAIHDFGNEMGGGPRTTVDPLASYHNPLEGIGKLGKAGQTVEAAADAMRSFKDAMRQRFVNEQVFPKAGLIKVLLDQGVDAKTAAEFAERAHGGSGAVMGGVETPGLMKMAETLNRNGVAMFTSYPLHSITRMLQLMESNPQIVMTYPLLRNYLTQASTPEIQQEAHDKAFGYDELPLPLNNPIGRFFANPSGGQGVINVSNAIPYGGAFGDMNFPNLYGYLHPGQKQIDAIDKSGLNPSDAAGAVWGERAKGALPGSLTALQQVYNASRGMTPTEGATQTQSVQQAIMKLVGLPFHNPETGLSREFDASKLKPIQGRMEFLQQLQSRYYDGKDSGEPDMTKRVDLQRMDYDKLSSALDSAINKSTELTTDRTLNQKQAYGMLRNQMGYIHSLMYLMKRAEPRAESFQQSQGIMTGGPQ